MHNHVINAALSAVDGYLANNPNFPDLDIVRARCRAMLRAYLTYWQVDNQRFEVLSVEEQVFGPIINPATKKQSDYIAVGKIDAMLKEKRNGNLIVFDHKALSSAIDEDRHEHLMVDTQPLQYALLKHLNGQRVNKALWDCLVKTSHKPRKPSSRIVQEAKPERIAARKTTEPNGIVYFKGDTIPARPEVREDTPGETFEEFEERLFGIYMAEPSSYFLRKPIPVLSDNLLEYAEDLYKITMLVDSAHKTGEHMKNPGACFEYNRPCKFLGICSGRTDPQDKSVWEQAGTNHAELELPEGIEARKVITNSRLKVFRSCQRKHYYQYELGLKKVGEVLDEALYVGSCVHAGLEAMFEAISEG